VGGQSSNSTVSEVVESVIYTTTDYKLGNEVAVGFPLVRTQLYFIN
jgi:hypothetical protein